MPLWNQIVQQALGEDRAKETARKFSIRCWMEYDRRQRGEEGKWGSSGEMPVKAGDGS